MTEPILHSFPADTPGEKRRQRQKKQEEMWKQPETLHLDMLCHTFDNNNSGVIECDDQLCDLQFVTHNLTAWKDVCLQHYVNKAEAGENTSFPSMCKISDGTQLNVEGHIVMNFYDTGVVMVQGKHLDTFKYIDFLLLKSDVSTWMNDANESINREKERRNLDNSKHSTATSISDVSNMSDPSEGSDHEHSMDTLANDTIPGSEQPAASKKRKSF